jgi:hypothetical protein
MSQREYTDDPISLCAVGTIGFTDAMEQTLADFDGVDDTLIATAKQDMMKYAKTLIPNELTHSTDDTEWTISVTQDKTGLRLGGNIAMEPEDRAHEEAEDFKRSVWGQNSGTARSPEVWSFNLTFEHNGKVLQSLGHSLLSYDMRSRSKRQYDLYIHTRDDYHRRLRVGHGTSRKLDRLRKRVQMEEEKYWRLVDEENALDNHYRSPMVHISVDMNELNLQRLILSTLPSKEVLNRSKADAREFQDEYDTDIGNLVVERMYEILPSDAMEVESMHVQYNEYNIDNALRLLGSIWYNATKLAMTLRMKQWSPDWMNNSPRGDEYSSDDNEDSADDNEDSDLVLVSPHITPAEYARLSPANMVSPTDGVTPYANLRNPYLHSDFKSYSIDSRYNRTPRDYLDDLVSDINNLVQQLYVSSTYGMDIVAKRIADIRPEIHYFQFDGRDEMHLFVDDSVAQGAKDGMHRVLDSVERVMQTIKVLD